MALREMGTPSLIDALDYLGLLADTKPGTLGAVAVRWHGRLELEASAMRLERGAAGACRFGESRCR
jgi:hypothetical protein